MFLKTIELNEVRPLFQYTDPRPEHLQQSIGNLLELDIFDFELLETIKSEHLQAKCVPGSEATVLYFAVVRDSYLLALIGEDDRRCLLCFTSPVKALVHAKVWHGTDCMPEIHFATLPLLVMRMQNELPKLRIASICIDPCPNGDESICASLEEVLTLGIMDYWATVKACNDIICDGLLGLARQEFLAGRAESAREVALELVKNFEPEQPEAHLLLGLCARDLGDELMLREANENLRLLGCSWALQFFELATGRSSLIASESVASPEYLENASDNRTDL